MWDAYENEVKGFPVDFRQEIGPTATLTLPTLVVKRRRTGEVVAGGFTIALSTDEPGVAIITKQRGVPPGGYLLYVTVTANNGETPTERVSLYVDAGP